MRSPSPVVAVTVAAVLAAGCGNAITPELEASEPAAATDEAPEDDLPADAEESPAPADASEPDGSSEPEGAPEPDDAPDDAPEGAVTSFDVRIDDDTIEVVRSDGGVAHAWTLPADAVFHSVLVHPDAAAGNLDAVAIALHGERPVLYHVSVRADADAGALVAFPDHLQPAHEVDAAPPTLAWTPDARSLVWTEPSGDGVALRTVGWDDGPGTGRTADDNASFLLDVAGGVDVDGFEPIDATTWTLVLRDSQPGDPIEVRMERQGDGALALVR